jgi:hypothetical protein
MSFRFTGAHRHRQSSMMFSYAATFVVEGRAVTWQAQVTRGSRKWTLVGGGIELPDEHAETGLGMTAESVVRLDVNRAIDGIDQ